MGVEVSPQGDVYSYGIFLLEMFTGKRPADDMFLDNEISLCNYVKKALPKKVMEIVDSRIIAESNISKMEICLTSILQTGILCCAERPRERIDMKDVLNKLTSARNLFAEVSRETERQERETRQRFVQKF